MQASIAVLALLSLGLTSNAAEYLGATDALKRFAAEVAQPDLPADKRWKC